MKIDHYFDLDVNLNKTTFPNNHNGGWVYWVSLLSITTMAVGYIGFYFFQSPQRIKRTYILKSLKKTMSRTVRVVKIIGMPMHNGSIRCIWQMHNPSWFPLHNSPLRGSLCIENNSGLCIYQYTQSTRCVLLQCTSFIYYINTQKRKDYLYVSFYCFMAGLSI